MSLRSFDDPNSIEARQHLLDSRCERLHPKRHRTGKRKAKFREAQKAKAKLKVAKATAARRRHHAAVSAYWRGEGDQHP